MKQKKLEIGYLFLPIQNMGNINTLDTHSQVPVNLTPLKHEQHPLLGSIQHLLDNHNHTNYFLLERAFPSFPEFDKSLKNFKNRSKLSKMKLKYLPNQFIIQVFDYRTAEYSELCGKTYKIFIFIQKFHSDLKQMLHHQQKAGQPFPQHILIDLMLKILNCLIELYDHNIKPFHLSAESIVFPKKQLKIIDQELTNQISPIDSLNYRSQLRKGTFIAPEMLSLNYESTPNTSKCDIFTLGILILEMAHLSSLDSVYDYNKRKINFSQIDAKITKLNYTEKFKFILKEMLEQFPEQRIGILRLKQNLTETMKSQVGLIKSPSLQESEHKPLPYDKGLIYLGKNPSQKSKNDSFSTVGNHEHRRKHSTSQISGRNESKLSYHKLLNEKREQRRKKSISFNEGRSRNSQDLLEDKKFQERRIYDMRKGLKETPQTNIAVTPEPLKYQNYENDCEDSKSDLPISPISLDVYKFEGQINLNMDKIGFIPNRKSSVSQRNHDSFHNQITFNKHQGNQSRQTFPLNHQRLEQNQQQIKLSPHVFQQPHYQMPTFDYNSNHTHLPDFSPRSKPNQFKNLNLQIEPQAKSSPSKLHPYPGSDFKLSQFPSFSLLAKPNIQQIQTPRITKHIHSDLPYNQFNKNQTQKHQQTHQTPIKSLELIQTQKRSQKDFNNPTPQKVFGRYDFSNGAVYEGEFNSDNQFQGNGVLNFSSGKVFYSGCWKKNQFHGFGILNNIENERQVLGNTVMINYKNLNENDNSLWTQYEGEFFQDKKHGFGTLYFVNGDKFSGCFVNDTIQGFGNFYSKYNQKTIMGIWINNIYREA